MQSCYFILMSFILCQKLYFCNVEWRKFNIKLKKLFIKNLEAANIYIILYFYLWN